MLFFTDLITFHKKVITRPGKGSADETYALRDHNSRNFRPGGSRRYRDIRDFHARRGLNDKARTKPELVQRRFVMKTIALVILALLTSVGAAISAASAFNENDLQKLKTTSECAGCDLSYAQLSGASLSNASLSNANLYGANLSGANLSSADLTGANLSAADISGANLSNATWIDGSWCRDGSFGSCTR